jgi:hypothetical protein
MNDVICGLLNRMIKVGRYHLAYDYRPAKTVHISIRIECLIQHLEDKFSRIKRQTFSNFRALRITLILNIILPLGFRSVTVTGVEQ